MKIFLNLISVNVGGQLIRATKFLEKIEKDNKDIQVLVVKKKSVLSEIKSTEKNDEEKTKSKKLDTKTVEIKTEEKKSN